MAAPDEYELTTLTPVTTPANFTPATVVFGSVTGQAAGPNTPPDVILMQAVVQYAAAGDQQCVLLAAVFN